MNNYLFTHNSWYGRKLNELEGIIPISALQSNILAAGSMNFFQNQNERK